jgi:mRNA-degrading endonuclease toxin of MazEF toxin-antitoxin module
LSANYPGAKAGFSAEGTPELGETGVQQASDIPVDQIRAIDNTPLTTPLGSLPTSKRLLLEDNPKKVPDL